MLRRARIAAVLAALIVLVVPAVAQAGTAPSLVGAVADAVNLSGADALAVSGNVAYATAYHAGELTAVDFSNPANPTIVSGTGPAPLQTNLIGGSNVTIAGGYAFVVSKNRNGSTSSNDDGNGNSLTILSLANPDSPTLVGTVRDAFGSTTTDRLFGSYGIAVQGNYAFVAYQGLLGGQPSTPDTSTGGFTVVDITNKAGPTVVSTGNIDNGSLPSPYTGSNALNHATSVALSSNGQYAFVNSFGSSYITVIDISTPTAPKIVKTIHDPANLTFVADLAVQGNYLYTANQVNGTSPQLTIYDVSTPSAPKLVGGKGFTDPNLQGAYRIRVRGDFVYISSSSVSTIGVVDVSNPAAPRLAGFVNDTTHLHSTTGLDLDPSGQYVVASSPYIHIAPFNENNVIYPPYPDSSPTAPKNTGTVSVIQLDPNPIGVTINSEPPAGTTSTSASFTFSTTDEISAAECQLDGGAMGPCTTPLSPTGTSGGASYSGLSIGSHTFTVQATDAAGTTSTQSYTWTVGTVPSGPVPTVPSSAMEGQTLTGTAGTWSGSPQPTLTYQWSDCDQSGQNCTAASGPGAQTLQYTATQNDVGSTLELTVTGTNVVGQSSQTSQPTAVVTASGGVPTLQSPPVIAPSSPTVGSQISASPGSWSGSPNSFSYQWERCDSSGQNCTNIGNPPSASTYTPVAADAGSTLVVAVTASNGVGQSAPGSSAATQAVTGTPTNTSAPTISGTASQGQTLTANPGSWAAYPAPSFGYAWQRCNSGGTSCSGISGATGQTYVLTRADVGNTVRVVVSASNGVGSPGSATSATAGPVAGPPVNTVAPKVTGSAVQGQTLTGTAGTWTGYPTPGLSLQWKRCNTSGELCSAITGATGTAYTLASADVGHTVRLYVRGTNSAGSVLVRSAQTGITQASAIGSAVLAGVASGSPQLKITARSTPGSPAFTRLTVSLPAAMSFAHQKSVLTQAVRALGHVRFTVSFRSGALVIVLAKPARSVTLLIGSRALTVAHAVRAKTQHKRAVHLKITLIIGAVTGLSARDTVDLRVS